MTIIVTVENPNDHFTPGQTIVGRVYHTPKYPSFVEIKIKLYCEECTHRIQPTKRTSTIDNQCWKNICLKSEDALIGSGHFDTAEHKFPFTLTLPLGFPSSYLGRCGYVKYFLKAEATSYSGEIENADKIELKVFSPINLNDLKNVSLVPSAYSRDLTLNRWFCVPEVLDMYVELEKNAFVLGETINVVVKLSNNTSMAVSTVLIELYSKVKAKVTPPSTTFLAVCQTLTEYRGTGLRRYRRKTYLFRLKIPDEAEIPNFQNCTLLSRKDFLAVTAVLENPTKRTVNIEIELILGHYSQTRTEDSIRGPPLAYGITYPSTEISKLGYPALQIQIPDLYPPPQNSSRSSIDQSYVGPNTVPPYPIDSKPNMIVNGDNLIVPVPEARKIPPYPEKEMNFPYPPGKAFPYPKEDNFSSAPYPTVGSFPLPRPNSKRSEPYPSDPPYPREETKGSIENSCPYPTDTKSNASPPYYKKEMDGIKQNKINMHSSTMRSSFEENILPYPKGEEKTSLLHSSFSDTSELPIKMPMPPQSFQTNVFPCSSNIQVPYRGSTSQTEFPPPTSSNAAPYPLEPSTMPMPSDKSSITCNSIGFAVPTSEPFYPTKSSEEQPSAPLLSDLNTPSIAELELEDLLFFDAYDEVIETREREQNYQSGGESSSQLDAPPSYKEVQPLSKKKKKDRSKRELLLAS